MTEANHTSQESRHRRKDGGSQKTRHFVRDVLIIFLVALLISFGLKTFVVRSFYIPSGSMENTLQINDRIIVNELVPRLGSLKRGDVVVFTDPGGWLPAEGPPSSAASTNPVTRAVRQSLTFVGLGTEDSDNHLIKRVIGLPGDKVTCCNAFGQLEVNGIPIKEPFVTKPAGQPDDAFTYSVTVPDGDLWVLGDNRYNSADSAEHFHRKDVQPFVPVANVVGRAFVITWPSSRWSFLSNYPSAFNGTNP